jgi:phosphate transport system substrate-binding protein
MKTLIKIAVIILIFIIMGCDRLNRDPYADTPTSGKIKIGVDETFRPVADAEILVFEGIYRYAAIKPCYYPENECFDKLLADSVRMIISSRPLNEMEKKVMWYRKIVSRETKIATDAIALIVNPANSDSVLSLNTLEKIMTGQITSWENVGPGSNLGAISVVFDHKNSSIVRYAVDSLSNGMPLTGNLYALDSNLDVVGYVSRTKNALGLIGVSWISDQDDSTQMSFLRKVRVVSLSREDPAIIDNSFKPYQAYIYDGSYPLVRDVYAINAEPRNGLATGFTSFLAGDKGQRIILKTGILPATAPVRLVKVRDDL